MVEEIYIHFSDTESTASALISNGSLLTDISAQLRHASESLWMSNLKGTFILDLQMRIFALQQQLDRVAAETTEGGRDLKIVVERARDVDVESAHLFETRAHFPYLNAVLETNSVYSSAAHVLAGLSRQMTPGALAELLSLQSMPLGSVGLLSGMYFLRMRAVNDGAAFVKQLTQNALSQGLALSLNMERNIDQSFAGLFTDIPQNGSQTIDLANDIQITIPGAVVAAPVSPQVGAEHDLKLTRNSDGIYELHIGRRLNAGVEAPIASAKGSLNLGRVSAGVGIESEVRGGGHAVNNMTFRFNPNQPGDMTRLTGLLGLYAAEQISGNTIPVLNILSAVRPSFAFDNVVEIQTGTGIGIEAGFDVDAVLNIVGASVSPELEQGGILRRLDDGTIEQASYWSADVESELRALVVGATGDGNAQFECVYNVNTQERLLRMTVISERQVETELKRSLSGLSASVGTTVEPYSARVESVFEFDMSSGNPIEAIRQAHGNFDNALTHVEVTTPGELNYGIEGKLGAAGQMIGFEANVSRGRETTVEVFNREGD